MGDKNNSGLSKWQMKVSPSMISLGFYEKVFHEKSIYVSEVWRTAVIVPYKRNREAQMERAKLIVEMFNERTKCPPRIN